MQLLVKKKSRITKYKNMEPTNEICNLTQEIKHLCKIYKEHDTHTKKKRNYTLHMRKNNKLFQITNNEIRNGSVRK